MKETDFTLTKEKNEKGFRFIIKGHISSAYADHLQSELDAALREKPASIILTMSDVVYLSSSGLKVILKTYKDAQNAGSTFGIETPSKNVIDILKMTALEGLLLA